MRASRHHIGVYVDDRNHASRSRAGALLGHLDADVTLLSAVPVEAVPGASDAPVVPMPGSPVGAGHEPERMREVEQRRAATLRQWWEQDRPDLLVIDGDNALAALAHEAGLATVAIRSLGASWPRADGELPPFIAPYPEELEAASVPEPIRARTTYVGGFSHLDDRELDRERSRQALGLSSDGSSSARHGLGGHSSSRPVVTIVTSDGLGRPAERRLLRATAATRGWRWLVAGAFGSTDGVVPDNLHPLGPRADLGHALAAADVVVSAGGHASTEDVASVRRPHLVLQEPGTSNERHAAVAQLVRAGIATVMPLWPDAENWPGLLRDVARIDTAPQRRYCDHGGARRLAEALVALAAQPGNGAGAPSSGISSRADVDVPSSS